MGRHKAQVWYTVYDACNDDVIAIGSARECAGKLGYTVKSFRSVVSRVKSGKDPRYCIFCEDLATGSHAVYGEKNTGEFPGRKRAVDDDIAWKMYLDKSSDASIARRLGVNHVSIWKWRKKNGLPPNCGRGRTRKAAV